MNISTNIKTLYVISDTDETKEQLISKTPDNVKVQCEIHQFTFDMIQDNSCKDISDYWQLMNNNGKTTEKDINELVKTIKDTAVKIDFGIDYCFWNENKNHTIDIIELYKEFARRGFALIKYNTENADSKTDFTLARISNNIIEKYDTNALCSYAIHSIAKSELQEHDKELSKDIQTQFSIKQALFNRQAMNNLDSKIVYPLRDSASVKRLCFKDCVIELKKATGKISKLEYNQLPAPIYDNTILKDKNARPIEIDINQIRESFEYYNTNRHFIDTKEPFEKGTPQTPFANFIKDICTKKDGETDTARLKALISVIGYMCIDRHETVAKIIVTTENNIDGKAQGGSGKSLIAKGVSYVQNTHIIGCKDLNQKHEFKYQSVTKHNRNLVFDDIRPDFDFTNLFNIPTEGMNINKKFMPEFVLAGMNAPKVMITANQALQDFGDDSTARRRFDMEIYKYFNKEYTPEQKYERFFDNWTSGDWSRFYGFILYCVLFYMYNGLCEYESDTKTYRQLLLLIDMDGIDCLRYILTDEAKRNYNESFGDHYEITLNQKEREQIRKSLIEATESNLTALSKPQFENVIRKYCEVYGIELNENKRVLNSRFWELKGTKEAFFIS